MSSMRRLRTVVCGLGQFAAGAVMLAQRFTYVSTKEKGPQRQVCNQGTRLGKEPQAGAGRRQKRRRPMSSWSLMR